MRPPKIDRTTPWVGVCLSPILINQFELKDSIVVIVDVLRATTTMCTAFDNGARSMIPVATLEEARDYKAKGFLAAAERDGEQIQGFDFGNSPFSFMNSSIKGKDICISTTNGTHAIKEAVDHGATEILIGSFANLSRLCEYVKQRGRNVVMLCAGWKDRPNLEDTIFAGAMVRSLRPDFHRFEDTALIAETLFRNANRRKRYFIRNSSHFHRLYHKLQIQKDVKYALRPDTHSVLPKLFGDRIYDLDGPYAKGLESDS